MSKGKSLPIAALFMVLVIALALLGVGYALWSDTLEVDGTVHTGEVDMAFSPCATNDEGVDPGYEKDVASCECALRAGDRGDGNGDNGPDGLTIRIENGYPSYSCEVSYDMTNIGSIPVHLYSVTEEYDASSLDYEQNCVDEGEAAVGPGYQLHPGEHVYCTIGLHVRQEAEENATYTLHKEYWWGQYNESPPDVSGDVPAPADIEEGFGVRYKSFGNTGSNEVYLGVGDLGVAANRVEAGKTWSSPGTYAMSFSLDTANDKITETVAGGPNLEFPGLSTNLPAACPLGEADFMIISVVDRDPGTVDFNNVVLGGFPLGDFAGVDGTFAEWIVTGFDFTQDFTVTGDIVLDGSFVNGDEYSKVQLLVGCYP